MKKILTVLLINTTILLACSNTPKSYSIPNEIISQTKPSDKNTETLTKDIEKPEKVSKEVKKELEKPEEINNKLDNELEKWGKENPEPVEKIPDISVPKTETQKDPRYSLEKGTVVSGCESFQLEGKSDKAILLLHGLGGCPYEMRTLGEYLNKEGYHISAVRYPGHGTTGKDLSTYSWKDWFGVSEAEYLELKKKYKTVYVSGFSTGGTLSLYLAEQYDIERLVLLSPFIYVSYKWYYGYRPETYLNSPVGKLLDYIPRKLTLLNINDPVAKKNYIAGNYFSFGATRSALDLIKNVKKDLKKVKSPTLIIQGRNDDTSDYQSSVYLNENLSSENKKLITLEKSNHVITYDYEYKKVFEETKAFFENK